MRGQSSVRGQMRSAACNCAQDLIGWATRITRAAMWGIADDQPEEGSSRTRKHVRGLAQGRRVVTEARLVGTTRHDGHAEDECVIRML